MRVSWGCCSSPQIIMRATKYLIFTAVILLLLCSGVVYILSVSQPPNLAEVICQPSDLGERYQLSESQSDVPLFSLEEAVEEAYTVTLIDHQLSNTVLECSIIRYVDKEAAHRAFEKICTPGTENLNVGEETCTLATNAPANLAFRRDAFLILMQGDVGDMTSPATAVDARLR